MDMITAYFQMPIRAVKTDNGWRIVAADVCEILGIENVSQAVNALEEWEKGICLTYTPTGDQEMLGLTEAGFTHLCHKSRKEMAKRLMKWWQFEFVPAAKREALRNSMPPEFHQLALARQDRILDTWEIMERIDRAAIKQEVIREIAAQHTGERGFTKDNLAGKYYRWLHGKRDWRVLDAFHRLYALPSSGPKALPEPQLKSLQ